MKEAFIFATEAIAVVGIVDFAASFFRRPGSRNLSQRLGVFAAVGLTVFFATLIFHP